jgi:hypothetical protein
MSAAFYNLSDLNICVLFISFEFKNEMNLVK